MSAIKKVAIDQADKFVLTHKLWGTDAYATPVYAQLAYDDTGFIVRFTVEEADPRRTKTQHLEHVHKDSCVEFFVNFTPDATNKYINFEVNANGVMNAGFRSGRKDNVPLQIAEMDAMSITPCIEKDHWTVTYKIGFDFIKKYFPTFDMSNCDHVRGNLYKCGDETEMEHYVSYFSISLKRPNFHNPRFFRNIAVK